MPACGELEQALPVWMEKQLPIAALHQFEPEAAKADGSIAQIMCFPSALRNPRYAKQSSCDFAVGGAFEPCVECAQGVDQVIALCLRESSRVVTGIAAVQHQPVATRCGQPHVEQRVQRQHGANVFAVKFTDCVRPERSAVADESLLGAILVVDPTMVEF